jgi:predicted RNA binding protein YcfA (HicA-like mRNA interferase family)
VPDIAEIIGMLDRDGALHLAEDAQEYGPWPERAEDEIAYSVDFDALSPQTTTAQDMPRGLAVDTTVIDDVLSGDGGLRGRDNAVPPLDVLGWYQPIHFFANNWGILIREKALVDLARDLAPRFEPFVDRRSQAEHVALLLRAAFVFVFLHEQYHHKIESLAIRMHVVKQRPVYPDFKKLVSKVVAGTDDDLQEAIANADAWWRLASRPYSQWFPADERRAIRDWTQDLFRHSPPGYRLALDYLSEQTFSGGENYLIAQVHEAQVKPARRFPSEFSNATHLTQSLFSLKQDVWTLVPAGQQPILPVLPGVFPLKTDKLERYIQRNGWEVVPGGGKGSHTKYRRNGQMIVIPQGKEVSLTVQSSTARTLGLTRHKLVELAK